MIDQNVIAGVLEHIAKGLRDGKLEASNVQQEAFFLPTHDPLDGHVNGHRPTGEFSMTLKYARKGESNG